MQSTPVEKARQQEQGTAAPRTATLRKQREVVGNAGLGSLVPFKPVQKLSPWDSAITNVGFFLNFMLPVQHSATNYIENSDGFQ